MKTIPGVTLDGGIRRSPTGPARIIPNGGAISILMGNGNRHGGGGVTIPPGLVIIIRDGGAPTIMDIGIPRIGGGKTDPVGFASIISIGGAPTTTTSGTRPRGGGRIS